MQSTIRSSQLSRQSQCHDVTNVKLVLIYDQRHLEIWNPLTIGACSDVTCICLFWRVSFSSYVCLYKKHRSFVLQTHFIFSFFKVGIFYFSLIVLAILQTLMAKILLNCTDLSSETYWPIALNLLRNITFSRKKGDKVVCEGPTS